MISQHNIIRFLFIFVMIPPGESSPDTSINMDILESSPSAGSDMPSYEVIQREAINPKMLTCRDFDSSCQWHNLRDDSINLKWYQSNAYLDPSYFQLTTNSEKQPNDYYAVAASDDPSNNKSKAILMSEVIQCSEGTSKFSMMYWVSPFVEITFCIKTIKKSYPNFDFCSVLPTKNSPGPVNIVIPPMGEDTFQVFIIAKNFTYDSPTFRGGFAIIDNIILPDNTCIKTQTDNPGYDDFTLTSFTSDDEVTTSSIPDTNNSSVIEATMQTTGISGPTTTLPFMYITVNSGNNVDENTTNNATDSDVITTTTVSSITGVVTGVTDEISVGNDTLEVTNPVSVEITSATPSLEQNTTPQNPIEHSVADTATPRAITTMHLPDSPAPQIQTTIFPPILTPDLTTQVTVNTVDNMNTEPVDVYSDYGTGLHFRPTTIASVSDFTNTEESGIDSFTDYDSELSLRSTTTVDVDSVTLPDIIVPTIDSNNQGTFVPTQVSLSTVGIPGEMTPTLPDIIFNPVTYPSTDVSVLITDQSSDSTTDDFYSIEDLYFRPTTLAGDYLMTDNVDNDQTSSSTPVITGDSSDVDSELLFKTTVGEDDFYSDVSDQQNAVTTLPLDPIQTIIPEDISSNTASNVLSTVIPSSNTVAPSFTDVNDEITTQDNNLPSTVADVTGVTLIVRDDSNIPQPTDLSLTDPSNVTVTDEDYNSELIFITTTTSEDIVDNPSDTANREADPTVDLQSESTVIALQPVATFPQPQPFEIQGSFTTPSLNSPDLNTMEVIVNPTLPPDFINDNPIETEDIEVADIPSEQTSHSMVVDDATVIPQQSTAIPSQETKLITFGPVNAEQPQVTVLQPAPTENMDSEASNTIISETGSTAINSINPTPSTEIPIEMVVVPSDPTVSSEGLLSTILSGTGTTSPYIVSDSNTMMSQVNEISNDPLSTIPTEISIHDTFAPIIGIPDSSDPPMVYDGVSTPINSISTATNPPMNPSDVLPTSDTTNSLPDGVLFDEPPLPQEGSLSLQSTTAKHDELTTKSNEIISEVNEPHVPLLGAITVDKVTEDIPVDRQDVCQKLTCTFDSDSFCNDYTTKTFWEISNDTVGDVDSNVISRNNSGGFAYVRGPLRWSRLLTAPFELSHAAVFSFDYRTALTYSVGFHVYVKRNDTVIETLLSMPTVFTDSNPNSWKTANGILLGGAYEYIAFEVRNLQLNDVIGIDSFKLDEFLGGDYCSSKK